MTDEQRSEAESYLRESIRTQKGLDCLDSLLSDLRKEQLRIYAMSYRNVGSLRARLASWIIDHLNADGQLSMSQREIARECGDWISISGVSKTMQALCLGKTPVLTMKVAGVYELSKEIRERFNIK